VTALLAGTGLVQAIQVDIDDAGNYQRFWVYGYSD
jgi:hypothetical protein